MAAVQRPPPFIPEIRRRPVDIIDVDLLDDEVINSRPTRRQRLSGTTQLQPDIITIIDSDDEAELQTGPSQPRVGQASMLFITTHLHSDNHHLDEGHRRMFSPPPPPQDHAVPPVPVLPPHLHGQRSFANHRNARPSVTGIVRPNEQPFAFEVNVRTDARQAVNVNVQLPPLAAAPPSHHSPSMGLGGALLATNRSNITHGNNVLGNGHSARLPRPPRSRWGGLPSIGDILSGDYFRREQADADMEDDALFAFLTAHADDAAQRPMFISQQARMLRNFEPEYKPAYTHPGKPLPGFTFDFTSPVVEPSSSSKSVIDVDDLPGSSASASSSSHGGDPNTILVCARCMDGLVTGDSNTGLEQVRRRIWALRCGHLIDGKCVEEIMKPATPVPIKPIVGIVDDVKGKGKELVIPEHRQGKGKAADSAPPEPSDLSITSREHNSIRSRLRPRTHPTFSYTVSISDHPSSARPVRPLPRQPLKGRARAKGKGKARALVVEAEHHWNCPVTSCAKVHTSLLIGGKWIMDEKSGAIPVYV